MSIQFNGLQKKANALTNTTAQVNPKKLQLKVAIVINDIPFNKIRQILRRKNKTTDEYKKIEKCCLFETVVVVGGTKKKVAEKKHERNRWHWKHLSLFTHISRFLG